MHPHPTDVPTRAAVGARPWLGGARGRCSSLLLTLAAEERDENDLQCNDESVEVTDRPR